MAAPEIQIEKRVMAIIISAEFVAFNVERAHAKGMPQSVPKVPGILGAYPVYAQVEKNIVACRFREFKYMS